MGHKRKFERTSRLGSWISLGKNILLRLIEIQGSVINPVANLENCKIAHSGCGGVLASFSPDSLPTTGDESIIFLFCISGKQHPSCPRISIRSVERVVFIAWNREQDHLIVVLSFGTVLFYNYEGVAVAPSLSVDAPQSFTMCSNGLAMVAKSALSTKLLVVQYREGGEYGVRELSLPERVCKAVSSISLLAVSRSTTTALADVDVLLTYSEPPKGSIVCRCIFSGGLPKFTELAVPIKGGRVLALALSPNSSMIAFIMEDSAVYLTGIDFSEVTFLLRADVEGDNLKQLAWCGNHCIGFLQTVRFDESAFSNEVTCTLHLVNVMNPDITDMVNDLPGESHLLPEVDGLWIMSGALPQLLQVAPPEVRRVFSVGSRATGALLLTTYDEFMTGNASAVGMIQNLEKDSGKLMEAICDCVAAASFEFDAAQQKRLLRIAAFGKAFCSLFDPDIFVIAAKRLRVRHHLHYSSVGMILSESQLLELGEQRLLQRLTLCDAHPVAFSVAEALGWDAKPILEHWALSQLRRASLAGVGKDQQLVKKIVDRLESCLFDDFSDLAQKVKMEGNGIAALEFLLAEKDATRQVPMLLNIGEPEVALKQAISSSSADLVFSVVLSLVHSRGIDAIDFLAKSSISRDLLLQYTGICEGNQKLMVQYFNRHPRVQTYFLLCNYFQEENRLRHTLHQSTREVAWEMLQECKGVPIQAAILSSKKEAEQSSRQQMGTTAFSPIMGVGVPSSPAVMEERYLQLHLRLIGEQTKLMTELSDSRFLYASIADTIRYALEHGRTSTAQRLKTAFSVPERMYQWCMLSAYSSTAQWDLIDGMAGISSSKNTVLGGEAFVTTLLSFKRPQQAKQYIARVSKIEDRMEFYVQCGDWIGAGAECRRSNDADLLLQLKERAKSNPESLSQINEGWNSSVAASGISISKLFS